MLFFLHCVSKLEQNKLGSQELEEAENVDKYCIALSLLVSFVIIVVIIPWGVGIATSPCQQFRNNRCVRKRPKFSCTIVNVQMSHVW